MNINDRELYGKYGIREISSEEHFLNSNGYSYERMISVKIDQRKFVELLEKAEKCEEWNKKYYEEMFVREQVPVVQTAYEKYQMFLELARSEAK